MRINYDLTENADDDFVICEQCGTFFSDTAELNTETKTVQVNITGCFGDTNAVLSLQDFLDEYGDGFVIWPDEPFNTLIKDVKDML